MNTMRGFTLIELMIVLAIMGILAAWGIPSFQEMFAQNRMVTNANNLVYTFQLARSEAITRARPIDVVAASGGWQNGWQIEEPALDTPCGSATTAIKSWEAMAGASKITVTNYDDNPPVSCYRFNGQGWLQEPSDPDDDVVPNQDPKDLKLCDDRTGEKGRWVNLYRIGRASVNPIDTADTQCM